MIYLDNAATSFPKPEPVYRAVEECLRRRMGNPWKAQYDLSAEAQALMEGARSTLNDFFRGEAPTRWVHAFNGTDALNMAIKGLVRPGDHVVISDLEHDSVGRPLHALERAGLIEITTVASDRGVLDPDAVRQALRWKTSLVALTHASNVLGTIQPIEAIAPIVRAAGALFLVDAAQSAGFVPIDLRATPIDVLALSGHKFLFGPTGTGALYVGPRAEPRPWREGDTGGPATGESQPDELPYRLEGGTPNVLGIAGLAAGIAWVAGQGPDRLRRRAVAQLQRVVDWAGARPGWRVAGRWEPDAHIGVLSLIPRDHRPQEVAQRLGEQYGIATRGGLHDAPEIHRALGTIPDGTLRISPGPFTTDDDIAALLDALTEIDRGSKG